MANPSGETPTFFQHIRDKIVVPGSFVLAGAQILSPATAEAEPEPDMQLTAVADCINDISTDYIPRVKIAGILSTNTSQSVEVRLVPDHSQIAENEYQSHWLPVSFSDNSVAMADPIRTNLSVIEQTDVSLLVRNHGEGEESARLMDTDSVPAGYCDEEGFHEVEGQMGSGNRSVETSRIAGETRIDTARWIAYESYSTATIPNVVLARAEDFPDALAGAPLARALDAPLLLTSRDQLGEINHNYIYGRRAETIYVLGGEAAVSNDVVNELEALATQPEVIRIAGDTRIETAIAIANTISAIHDSAESTGQTPENTNENLGFVPPTVQNDTVYLMQADAYNAALSAGPLAARNGASMLLSDATGPLAQEVATFLAANEEKINTVVAVGAITLNQQALEQATQAATAELVSIGNEDPIQTSFDAARYDIQTQDVHVNTIITATANEFPDGLAGAPFVAAEPGRVLVQVDGDATTNTHQLFESFVTEEKTTVLGDDPNTTTTEGLVFVGGPNAINYSASALLSMIVNGAIDNPQTRGQEQNSADTE